MQALAEMQVTLPITLHGGAVSTTTEVWKLLRASMDGDFARVLEMVAQTPALASCMYDYTTPLHMAVRGGHRELVAWLIGHGGYVRGYRTHPFLVPLDVFAEDRGQAEIAALIRAAEGSQGEDVGQIDYRQDAEQTRFQEAVDRNEIAEAAAMLRARPDLALNELAFWGEGILMMPAKGGAIPMLELLTRHGARVPDRSKWGARYYFERLDRARFLLESGMNPNHANWRGFTLLHDMAFENDIEKARLLLDFGADINAIDDDFSSSPLGYAAQFGNLPIVRFLLENGADVNAAGAPWAKPIEWAKKKGHLDVEKALMEAGAA